MKNIHFFIFVFSVVFSTGLAQTKQESTGQPKYLPVNKAETYVDLTLEQREDLTRIEVTVHENTHDRTFYLLKGSYDSNQCLRWEILAVFANPRKKGFQKTYFDKNTSDYPALYRVMVKDALEHLEYTAVASVDSDTRQDASGGI